MTSSVIAFALLSSVTMAALAAPNDGLTGAYARVEVGTGNVHLSGAVPQAVADDHGRAFKVFGGYRFDGHIGLEAGYAALGSFGATVATDGARVRQDVQAHSLFGAATGRLPLGDAFALHGRLGLSAGRVSGTNALPAGDDLTGSKTSVLFGVGAEYRPRPNVALTVNADHYGKVSDRVRADALVFGLHFTL